MRIKGLDQARILWSAYAMQETKRVDRFSTVVVANTDSVSGPLPRIYYTPTSSVGRSGCSTTITVS